MNRKVLFIAIPLLLLAGAVGWRYSAKQSEKKQMQQGAGARRGGPATVQLAVAGPKRIVQAVDAVGSLQSPYNVQITSKVTGRIEYLQAREGDDVRPGQVLVKIDPSELKAAVLQQQAAVAQARSRLAEAKYGQGPNQAAIQGDVRQQTAELSSTKADLDQVRRNYDAQVAAAQAGVTDAEAKVDATQTAVANAQASLQSAQSNLKNAQTKLARTQNLFNQGFIAAQDVDDAKTEVEVQQSAVKVAQGQVKSAQASVNSAQAQLRSAQENLGIVKRKGLADIAAAQARVTQAESKVDVAAANRAQNPAYAENISALQASVAAVQAQLDQARSRLQDTTLTSPVQGSVTSRSLDPGALASPGTPILTVQFLDWLYVDASVPVEQAGSIFTGQPAEVTFDGIPNKTFQGSVSQVNAAADPQSRQVGVSIKLQNPGHLLKPGMFGKVRFITRAVDAPVTVPLQALNKGESGPTLTVVGSDGIAHVRQVTTGLQDGQSVQILGGVKVGEKVVVLTYQPIKEGQKVNLPGAGKADTGVHQ